MKNNHDKKEKRIKNLIQLDLKKEFKEKILNKNELNEPKDKSSKTNKHLDNFMNEKLKLSNSKQQIIKKQRKNDKYLSSKIQVFNSPINNNKISNKNSPSIFDINDKAIFKTKIYRVIGKKVNNFPKIFEDKTNSLLESFDKFKKKY